WAALDAQSAYLESMGYTRLGDYTSNAPQVASRGFARFFSDAAETRIVELQHFERLQLSAAVMGDEQFEPHVSMMSIVGGRIRVQASDRPVHPSFYVMRHEEGVLASYKGALLPDLLEKHAKLVEFVAARTAKPVLSGFTLPRYIGAERERFAAVKARL